MRKKISNFRFEKFVFFLFLFALALISAKSAAAQIIMSNSSNILEIKASSTLTNSVLKFVPSTSANSFSLQGIAPGATTVSIFDYLSSTSSFKMLNGTLNYNPSNNYIGIGMTDPGYKFDVSGTGRFTAKLMLDAAEGLGVYGIRGRTSNEQVEMYQKVSIGSPNGWGTFPQAPGGGLSVYGGANFATNNGNVGIGTTSPSAKLTVSGGNIFITDAVINSGTPQAAITKTYLDSALETYGSKWILNGSKLYASSTAWNVGIGTTNPNFKLDVTGAISNTSGIYSNLDLSGYNALKIADNVAAYSPGSTAYTGPLMLSMKSGLSDDTAVFNEIYFLSGSKVQKVEISTYWWSDGSSVSNSIYKANFSGDQIFNQVKFAYYNGKQVLIFGDASTAWNNSTVAYVKSSTQWWAGKNDAFTWSLQQFTGSDTDLTYIKTATLTRESQLPYWNTNGNNLYNLNSGNIGIGTTNPRAKFEVAGNMRIPATGGKIIFGSGATGSEDDYLIIQDIVSPNPAFQFMQDNSSKFVIQGQTGNVGIGTTNPEAKLSVSGGNIFITDAVIGSSTPHAAITKTYLDSAIQALASTTSYWTANGTHIFNTNTGNVGVGTSNPGQQLEITKNFRLPATVGTSAYGVIYKGISSFIHDFNYGLNGNGITTAGGNTFVGLNAGNFTMGSTATSFSQSSSNTGVGYYSLFANTTGYSNSALGYQSLLSNTTGHSNSALGYLSLSHNTTGYGNSALGYLSLENNTTGGNNSALGFSSLRSNTTGGGNSAFGYDSLVANSTGSLNSAFGDEAGKLLATGGVKTTGDLGLYLGYSSKASADGTDNEIVIGALAVGNGSNSVTLGNNSIAKTVLKGNVGIGTTTPAAGLEVLTGSNYSILAGGKRVGNVAAPVTGTDAVNRNYVDSNFIASTTLPTITNAFVQGGNSFGAKAILGTNDNQALGIETNGTEKMTILANGNVGIGTPTPGSYKLNVNGSIYAGSIYISTPGSSWITGKTGTGGLNAATPQTSSAYFPVLRQTTASGHVVNLGGLGDAFGFYGYDANRTENGTDYSFTMNLTNGNMSASNGMSVGGNLGVGTASPSQKLHVVGNSYFAGNVGVGTAAPDSSLSVKSAGNAVTNIYGVSATLDYGAIQVSNIGGLTNPSGRPLVLQPNAGNVGIGTTAPTHKLHVAGDANFSDNQIHGVSAPATGTDAANRFYVDGLITDLSGQIAGISSYWSASGTNIFNNNTGNVGIGTNAPSQKLDVVGSVNVSTGYRINNIATNGKYLRGNGTNFVESSIQAGDVPTLNQNTAGYAGNLVYEDNRAISPSELVANRMKFGFTSYANNSSSPYADFLHFNSYGDVSGGNANLLVINKSGIGMRLYQQVFSTTTNFSAYKDVVLANNTPALNYLTKYASTGNSVTVSSSQVYDNGTKVGVGTTAPSHKLHVVGEGNFNSSQVHGVSSPTVDTDVANQGYVKSSVEGSAFWKLSGSNVYTSSTAWNVGIGVNDPGAYKLFVAGNSYLSGKVNIGKSDSYGELEILHRNTNTNFNDSVYPLRIKNDSWSGNQITGIEFWNGSQKTVPTARIISQMAGDGGGGENLHFQTQTKSATNPNPNQPTTKMTITNTGEVGIGTATPTSKLHVVGSSYLNGTIKTNLTGTGSRCLHVDASGVIGTMAGDCGTSTGGDNLGNGIASSNIALGNYWLSGDGNNEGIFVNSTGNVGIGTTNPQTRLQVNETSLVNNPTLGSANGGFAITEPGGLYGSWFGVSSSGNTWMQAQRSDANTATYSILLNPFGGNVGIGQEAADAKLSIKGNSSSTILLIDSADPSRRAQLKIGTGFNNTPFFIDSLFRYIDQPTFGGSSLSLNPSGGSITVGGTIYNTNGSYWLRFDETLSGYDSLKAQGDFNTAGVLETAGTARPNYMMGRLGLGTTNPATTAGMTIDTPVASSSILFRGAGTDRAILSFKNGFFLGKDDTTSFSYSGVSNIGIGHGALERGSGDGNIAIGEFAAYYNNAANNNIAIGNGAAQVVNTSGNIALGWQAFGSSGATGGNNIAIGVAALANGAVQKNIAIGDGALNTASVGSYNIAIGNRGAAGSNKLYIGDLNGGVSPYTPLIYGDMTSTTTGAVGIKTTNLQSGMAMTVAGKIYADDFIYSSSDARLKHDIKNLSEIDYQKILKLRPVSFTYNKNNSKGFGFIAQELEKLYPEMVETNESDGMKSVTYDNLISPTIMAIQEQQKKIEEQETLIQILLDRVNKLENSTK